MRILICPDKFGGSLTAVQVATAVAEGWAAGAPADTVTTRALADGGPGFVTVLAEALGGTLIDVPCTDPLGRPVQGSVLVHDGTGYVESAQACGLHLISEKERITSSRITQRFQTINCCCHLNFLIDIIIKRDTLLNLRTKCLHADNSIIRHAFGKCF